ncbi:MAG TPA: PAS domain S-box protein, partial [Armatimonadota bacterium]|nr:PAS domain S-box protein [Armatimonadota bacterium]
GTPFEAEVLLSRVEVGGQQMFQAEVRDISQRKRREDALRESEERYRALVEDQTEFIVRWMADGTRTFVSESYRRCFGLTEKEAIAADFWPLVHEHDREMVRARIEALSADAPVSTGQHRAILPGGEVRWQLWTDRATFGEDGSVIGYLSVGRDIHEWRAAEDALRDSEERFRITFEQSPIAGVVASLDGHVLDANDSLCRLTGYSRSELVGMHGSEVLPPDEWERLAKARARLITGAVSVLSAERRLRRKDGAELWVHMTSRLAKDADGNPLYVLALSEDITEARQAREELEAAHAELRTLAGRLISAQEEERRRIARELHDDITQRLAVAAIEAGKIEAMSPHGSPVTRGLAAIRDELAKLSQDIHGISRQLHPTLLEYLGLDEAIGTECDSFAQRESIDVTYDVGDIPAAVAEEVSVCLFRIAQEGLRNIAKHAQTDKASVRLELLDDHLVLTVSDSGVGFDATGPRTKPGMGLASMEERARLVLGQLSIESHPGQGTTVRARIPLARE